MRLGILGGTFDPVHYGHLLLAETAREQCRLDQVWFLPAAIPPHKQGHELSSVEQRIEMLELAVAGNPAMIVSRLEADRGGVTYTVDTLAALAAEECRRELLFLMGADSLADLPNWREPERICQLAILAVVRRAGQEVDYSRLADLVPAERLELFRQHQVEMPLIELSSHDIRQRVGRGQSIRYRTPRAVETIHRVAGTLSQVAVWSGMGSGLLKIAGGTVYDPAHGVDGQVRDLWIDGGKIVAAPTDRGSAAGARARRAGPGRHAGRHRHALPYRRPQDERRAASCGPKRIARPSRCCARPARTAAPAEACPARLPRAIATPAWVTPRRSMRR